MAVDGDAPAHRLDEAARGFIVGGPRPQDRPQYGHVQDVQGAFTFEGVNIDLLDVGNRRGAQERGSNVARLISVEVDTARFSGIPLMSAIPVKVERLPPQQ